MLNALILLHRMDKLHDVHEAIWMSKFSMKIVFIELDEIRARLVHWIEESKLIREKLTKLVLWILGYSMMQLRTKKNIVITYSSRKFQNIKFLPNEIC